MTQTDKAPGESDRNLKWFAGLARKHGHHAQADWLDAQIAAPALPEDMVMGWRPIETAPKDGRSVLFATPEPGDWRYHLCRDDDYHNGAFWLKKATHWMPLPKPPASSGEA